jgi:hypothetical protein
MQTSDIVTTILERLDIIEATVGIGHNGDPPVSVHLDDDYSLDRRLPTVAVAQRYDVSVRTVDRWAEDPVLKFPKPLVINRRRYWILRQLRAWDLTRIRTSACNKNPSGRLG